MKIRARVRIKVRMRMSKDEGVCEGEDGMIVNILYCDYCNNQRHL